MRQKPFAFFIVFLVVLIFISGCQKAAEIAPTLIYTIKQLLPTATSDQVHQLVPTVAYEASELILLPTATNPPAYHTDDGIALGANLNCPDRAAFGYIDENVPARNVLVNYPIIFRWYYFAAEGAAPDWSAVCVPTSFTLYLSPGPDYSTTVSYSITSRTPDNLVNLLMYSYNVHGWLQPHTSYRWIIVGHAGGVDIDEDQLPLFQDESAWKLTGNNSLMSGQFQTGPACDPQLISSVNLLNPQDEAVLDTDTPYFQWDMPNCSSSAYWLSFDTDPLMASPDVGWVTGQEGFLMFSGGLEPCTIYYWHVQAGLYSVHYHLQNGNWATASEIRSFIIRSSDCPDAEAVPTATPTATLTPTNIPTRTPIPTQTPEPPTRTPKPPPTPIVCSSYKDEKSCEEHGDVCCWYQPPTGGDPYCKSK
ncbi:MAG: hypothetical protein K8R40_08810 [Anaerolineaceae bacterium]|nr:hypothetical protein [Anaerolineaceae bacterium]